MTRRGGCVGCHAATATEPVAIDEAYLNGFMTALLLNAIGRAKGSRQVAKHLGQLCDKHQLYAAKVFAVMGEVNGMTAEELMAILDQAYRTGPMS